MSQVEATSSVEIDCPADTAWAVVSDAEQNPRWQGGMRACRWVTQSPLRVGSRYEQEAVFLGRTITSLFEVTALEPGRELTIRTIESTFPIKVHPPRRAARRRSLPRLRPGARHARPAVRARHAVPARAGAALGPERLPAPEGAAGG